MRSPLKVYIVIITNPLYIHRLIDRHHNETYELKSFQVSVLMFILIYIMIYTKNVTDQSFKTNLSLYPDLKFLNQQRTDESRDSLHLLTNCNDVK